MKPALKLVLAPAVVAATIATTAITASAASADTGPVTGGTSTISIAAADAAVAKKAGISIVALAPATATVDTTAATVNLTLPVTGGDASVNTLFGTLVHGGSLKIVRCEVDNDGWRRRHRCEDRRQVVLNSITFNIEDDTVTAIPAGKTAPIVFFDAVGNHDFASGTPETFTASDLEVDAAGAQYLDRALRTGFFTATQHVGTFATSFTNSND